MTPEQRKAFMEHMHQTPGIIESILIDMDRVLDTLRMQQDAIESLRAWRDAHEADMHAHTRSFTERSAEVEYEEDGL